MKTVTIRTIDGQEHRYYMPHGGDEERVKEMVDKALVSPEAVVHSTSDSYENDIVIRVVGGHQEQDEIRFPRANILWYRIHNEHPSRF